MSTNGETADLMVREGIQITERDVYKRQIPLRPTLLSAIFPIRWWTGRSTTVKTAA